MLRRRRRRGGDDKAGRSGQITDTSVQAQSTGSHSYQEALASPPCPRTRLPQVGRSNERGAAWTHGVGQDKTSPHASGSIEKSSATMAEQRLGDAY